MGQRLRDDKIGQLTHSAGNITMAASLASPAYLTVGGRQYTITSSLSVALPSMAANTRYQVFAVQSGGVVSLAISQNENSVGPAGFLSWKLVGSFSSNGLSPVTFGAFFNIDDSPECSLINGGPVVFNSTGTPPTKGTVQQDQFNWRRIGNILEFDIRYFHAAAGTNGTGVYRFPLPVPGVSINTDLTGVQTGLSVLARSTVVGSGSAHDAGNNIWANAIVVSSNSLSLQGPTSGSPGTTYFFGGTTTNNNGTGSDWWGLGVSNRGYQLIGRLPILEWSTTPIKDL